MLNCHQSLDEGGLSVLNLLTCLYPLGPTTHHPEGPGSYPGKSQSKTPGQQERGQYEKMVCGFSNFIHVCVYVSFAYLYVCV